MPFLTVIAEVLITLGARLLVYVFAMLIGGVSTILGMKYAEHSKRKRDEARKAAAKLKNRDYSPAQRFK